MFRDNSWNKATEGTHTLLCLLSRHTGLPGLGQSRRKFLIGGFQPEQPGHCLAGPLTAQAAGPNKMGHTSMNIFTCSIFKLYKSIQMIFTPPNQHNQSTYTSSLQNTLHNGPTANPTFIS